MYIQKAEITNIKSIEKFEIEFKNPAGWHVLIGDNGSGKTTIVKAIALALVGEKSQSLRENWTNWINSQVLNVKTNKSTQIKLFIYRDKNKDEIETRVYNEVDESTNKIGKILKHTNFLGKDLSFYKFDDGFSIREIKRVYENTSYANVSGMEKDLWRGLSGWFSSAFGPFRRFEGGSSEWEEIYENPFLTRLAAHLSIFNESVALTEPIKWLKDLNYKSLEDDERSKYTLENLKKLINSEDFLPHNSKLEKISSDGVFFKDGNGSTIAVNQMSDGYRSILSLTFELIRQLVRIYGSEKVFKNIEKGEIFIDLPGVVLIDEIDAHLHPTWQTRIGQWFTQYFPQLQFIVTTHSPLVCRAAEKGSIWRLAAPGSDEESGEVTGVDRDRLIYGDILDAYGTEIFGSNVSISKESVEKQEDLIKLSKKEMLGIISDDEQTKLDELREIFPNHAEVEP